MLESILTTDWHTPRNIGVAITTRQSGNYAAHVGDDPATVIMRRRQLHRQLGLPTAINFLTQQHTRIVSKYPVIERPSDAVISDQVSSLAVLTADCLPILLCDATGTYIAAVHAGWRGLLAGILAATITSLPTAPTTLTMYIGPAICQRCFEVGQEVYDVFYQQWGRDATERYFVKRDTRVNQTPRWYADLSGLAMQQARELGVRSVIQSGLCSACLNEQFYSYRRNKDNGRFASIIWRKS